MFLGRFVARGKCSADRRQDKGCLSPPAGGWLAGRPASYAGIPEGPSTFAI
jgi:hypothetical protein